MPIPLETVLDKLSPEARRAIDERTQAIVAANRSRRGDADAAGTRPPRLAETVFSLSLREADRAVILIDLKHRFEENIRRYGPTRAMFRYWLDTIRAIGPLLMIRLGQSLAPSWLSRHFGEARAQRRP